MDFRKYGNSKLLYLSSDNIRWGEVVTRKEDPETLRKRYKISHSQTNYVRNKLIALKYLGYKYAKLLSNGRVQVYGFKVEPRYIDFLDLEEEGKEYRIGDIIDW